MATATERKALLFFGVVAMLGAGVRVWRGLHPGESGHGSYSAPSSRAHSSRSEAGSTTRRTSVRGARPASRSKSIIRDSDALLDLDRATAAQIDALGLLPRGMGRLIVADRDSFGPFGSLDELRRVPFLTASTLRKLAPRVTFSRVPRPRNSVIDPRSTPDRSQR